MADERHVLLLETRGDESVLLCSTCKRPILTIRDGALRIQSKHGSTLHDNSLTASHLKMLAIEMNRQTGGYERW